MPALLRFHVYLYARPAAASPGMPVSVEGRDVTPLVADPAALLTAWSMTFDQAAVALARLPRMFIEPDGSFVWVGEEEDITWQVDGVLYDRGDGLAYVELKGSCPLPAIESLLAALSSPGSSIVLQRASDAMVLEFPDFLRLAGSG